MLNIKDMDFETGSFFANLNESYTGYQPLFPNLKKNKYLYGSLLFKTNFHKDHIYEQISLWFVFWHFFYIQHIMLVYDFKQMLNMPE